MIDCAKPLEWGFVVIRVIVGFTQTLNLYIDHRMSSADALVRLLYEYLLLLT